MKNKGKWILSAVVILFHFPLFAQTDTIYTPDGIEIVYKEHGTGSSLAGKKFTNCHYIVKTQKGLEIRNTYKLGNTVIISLVDNSWKQAWINALRKLHVGDDVRITVPDSVVMKYWQAFLPTQPFKPFPLKINFLVLSAMDDLPPDVIILDERDTKIPPPFDITGLDTVKLKSGLKYIKVHDNPEGDQAYNGRRVLVHYTGYFEDGSIFDASYVTGQAYTFTLTRAEVIAGLDEGVRLMKTGDRYRFIIPPSLGYGKEQHDMIPPNTTLIFDVELISVDL